MALPAPPPYHRRPVVLVVDDEQMVRDLAQRALSDEYNVLLAADGEEALALLGMAEIDAVVTDLLMPGLSGLDLAAAMKGLDPCPPMLFISGYGGKGEELPGPLLAKPFLPEALRLAVRRLLRPARAAPWGPALTRPERPRSTRRDCP
jgi:CheY-like chemotaxis protein